MTEEDMTHVFSIIPKLATALKTTFGADGINIVNNNGPVAGQTVFHYHVHLIPRYSFEDSFNVHYVNNTALYTPESLTELKEEIIANL